MTMKRFILILLLTLIASSALEAYYDPHIGRFTQRDPAGDGINWYAYAANNPIKYVDPNGLAIIFADSGITISDVSQVGNVDIGSLTTPDQVLYYGLFGSRGSEDAADAISFLDLDATGEMLAGIINSSTVAWLRWADLGENIYGGYNDKNISINSNSKHGFGTTLTALFHTTSPKQNFKGLRLTLAHELQHVADDSDFFGLPASVPGAPSYIRHDLRGKWRAEYSAYTTEMGVAYELGQISAGYHSASSFTANEVGPPFASIPQRAIGRLATVNARHR